MATKNQKQKEVPTAEGIASAARNVSKKGHPPVHLWDPPFCGNLDIRICLLYTSEAADEL